MNDLVQFVRARYDEIEGAANAASSGPWRIDPRNTNVIRESVGIDWVGVAGHRQDLPYQPPIFTGQTASRWGQANRDANHIVLHDPASVLRDIEAKRRLLEQFELRGNSVRATVKPATGGVWDDLLRILALPYADHPDYRAEWKP